MGLSSRLEFAITELRVQMLSTEVLFGFQLQSTFREEFSHLSSPARALDVVALTSLVVTLCALIAGPAQHRIVERGNGHSCSAATLAALAHALTQRARIQSSLAPGPAPRSLPESAHLWRSQ